jgi:serine/tyrosine/threonine adenylyltransferase
MQATPAFDNSYVRDLDEGFYVVWPAAQVPAPKVVWFNDALAEVLSWPRPTSLSADQHAQVFSGNHVPPGAQPLAQAYAGHQFGGFSPQLGDGRALLLGEVIDAQGQRRDVAFKGSGRTPFSRGGDGKAAIGAVLREVILGEAMHALGIPTTRALAATLTGERIRRDGGSLPGAVLTRVALSHLRVGTFEFFSARGDHTRLRQLADYAIARHDGDLQNTPGRYLAFLERVAHRQARLIAQWMGVGFIHGVMNTDNMTISGETIDYGPCAFMEAYDPSAVFSSIDHQGRYAFGNQPGIAQWNLARLAQALLPLLQGDGANDADEAVEQATAVLEAFGDEVTDARLAVAARKVGLDAATADAEHLQSLMSLLHTQRVDHTLAFRRLNAAASGAEAATSHWLALFTEPAPARQWLAAWHRQLQRSPLSNDERTAMMHSANPAVIPRNHRVEAALKAATEGEDFAPFEALVASLRRPFDDRADDDPDGQAAPPAVTAAYQTYCGT